MAQVLTLNKFLLDYFGEFLRQVLHFFYDEKSWLWVTELWEGLSVDFILFIYLFHEEKLITIYLEKWRYNVYNTWAKIIYYKWRKKNWIIIEIERNIKKIIVAYITNRLQIINHNYNTTCLYVNHIGFHAILNCSYRLNEFKVELRIHRITVIGYQYISF